MQNNKNLLGIKIDSKLNFEDQIGRICTKSQFQIKCFDQEFQTKRILIKED